MNIQILHPEVQQFINDNLNIDIPSLVLKKQLFEGVSNSEIAKQIEAKNRSKKKLPLWYSTESIYYPEKLNIEQCSSEKTAKFKANLVGGHKILDVTGGFGVDSYYFSKRCEEVHHIDLNEKLSVIVSHNFKALNAENIETVACNGIEFLKNTEEIYDWIYIDPSRRDDIKGKVFHLSDCQPSVIEHLDLLFHKTTNILIKTSPMLDISKAIEELSNVQEVYIVSTDKEVKELLFSLKKDFEGEPTIKVVELKESSHSEFSFLKSEEVDSELNIGELQSYLYEPNAGMMKSGAFKLIARRYCLQKLHQHSHLYTSTERIEFPGRVFKIKDQFIYSKGEAKKVLFKEKANLSVRNFPISASDFKKQYKMKDGGETYYFLTTNNLGKQIIIKTEKA